MGILPGKTTNNIRGPELKGGRLDKDVAKATKTVAEIASRGEGEGTRTALTGTGKFEGLQEKGTYKYWEVGAGILYYDAVGGVSQ